MNSIEETVADSEAPSDVFACTVTAMSDVNSLKNQARKAEQAGDWPRAIDLYQRALELGEKGFGALDVSLYNRVGDLHLRLGDTESAIAAYETAAESYTEQELFPSAIALCKKILRTAGDQSAIRLRLGRLEGRTGLFADARNNFLEYAQAMEEEGRFDDALDALKELVDLSDDEEGRVKLAEHLYARDRGPEAVEQLERVAQLRRQRGGDASEILRRMSEMRSSTVESAPAAAPAPDDEPGSLDLESELLEAKQGLQTDEAEIPVPAEPSGPPTPEEEISELTSRLSSTPDDHHSRVRYAQLLAASGRLGEARTEFERAFSNFDAAGEHHEAMHVVDELLCLDPDDLALHARRIRVAARLEDEGALINSYLQLGTCIEKRLSSFSMRLLSSSSESGDVSTVFDISQKTSTNL